MHARFLFALVAAAVGTALYAQSSTPPARPQPGERGPDTLVQQRASDLSALRGRIAERGAAQQLSAMEALTRTYFRAFNRSVEGITNAEQLNGLDATHVAIFLVTAGYNPEDLKGDRSRSESLVRSASNILFGRSTINDEMAVSPIVFVGRLVSVQPNTSPNDGFRSTATFEVVTAVKGSLEPGRRVQIRQRSGPLGGGEHLLSSGEFTAGLNDGEYLLFATPTAYHLRSRGAQAQVPDGTGYFSMILAPYEVRGGTATPTMIGQASNGFAVSSLK